ncbi:abasic site processing protein YoqW isoform X2 [Ricinus communis]|uniref:Embryonic stem cell-specific 5-hydroxymethylcytosine-binding protein n=1 Tax=Ricinus communis TaxID=3988 RepID=B9SMM8_RICCO|nr:abasic site processing protein YoqW isoform X2 [Ricinus communis]EEF35091.1 conserved hypothetical protein [Ricinus communis]|eukprot:XP_002527247.1 uncharacterized protein LOC8259686 isoform X1 [Ricinus communis]
MCGRARCTLRADDIPRACHRTTGPVRSVNMDRWRPSYNVSPGSNMPVVCREGDGSDGGDGFFVQCMTWGLIPSFTKKTEKPDFYKMFNARSESVGEKASFRRLLPKSRCLVAAEGFYEWKKDGSKKQPYYIHFKDGRPLVFAALYDSWQNSEGEILYTFTILTTSSSSALEWLHDRMPVILGDKESTDTWLNGSSSSKYDVVLESYESSDLVWCPVTPAMGKSSFDGPECVKEIHVKTESKSTISKFFSRKEIKGEQELNSRESTFDKSVKMDLPESVKEEYESEEKLDIPPSNQINDQDLKSNVSTIPCEDETKCQIPDHDETKCQIPDHDETKCQIPDHDLISNVSKLPHEDATLGQPKRHHEEALIDRELNPDGNEKLRRNPARKKANLKSGGDKQPTLLSYFRKK